MEGKNYTGYNQVDIWSGKENMEWLYKKGRVNLWIVHILYGTKIRKYKEIVWQVEWTSSSEVVEGHGQESYKTSGNG